MEQTLGTDSTTQVENVPRNQAQPVVASAPALAADRTRWGPIWAGLVTTFSILLVLETLFFAVGGLTPTTANTVSTQALWVQWILALAAFLAGGVIAAATSSVRGPAVSLLNGFMVWALATSLIMLASLLGAGAALGAVGNLVGQISPSHVTNITPSALSHTKTVAAWALLTLVSTAIAAAFGGWLGGFGKPIGHVAREKRLT